MNPMVLVLEPYERIILEAAYDVVEQIYHSEELGYCLHDVPKDIADLNDSLTHVLNNPDIITSDLPAEDEQEEYEDEEEDEEDELEEESDEPSFDIDALCDALAKRFGGAL